MKTDQKTLEEITWGDLPVGLTVAREERIVDTDRWHTYYDVVITDGRNHYLIEWGRGSTEYQEWDGDITCRSVTPVEKTVIDYV